MGNITVSRNYILPEVELVHVNTDKFKSGVVGVFLTMQHDAEHASLNALLQRVLSRGSSKYPDTEAMSRRSDELYSTWVSGVSSLYGEIYITGMCAGFPDDRYLPGETGLLEKAVEFAGDMLYNPLLENGAFKADYVEQEKQKQIERIEAQINDRTNYAVMRHRKVMFAEEPFGVNAGGEIEQTREITPESLYAWYKQVISECNISVSYCGGDDEERVADAIRRILAENPRSGITRKLATSFRDAPETPGFVSEEIEVTQGTLVMGFRYGDGDVKELPAVMLFNVLYGGSPISRLFMNVREKLSLCYFAQSSMQPQKGVMFVISGIAFDKLDAAREEILAQLQAMRDGDISEQDMMIAKMLMVMSVKSIEDTPAALSDYYMTVAMGGLEWNPQELCEKVNSVSIDDVRVIASRMKLDTTYWLYGKEKEESK